MNGYTDHGGTKNAAVEDVAGLEDLKNCAVGVVWRFRAVERLVKVRVKGLTNGIEALRSEPGDVVEQLLVDQLESFTIVLIFGFAMGSKCIFKTVDDGDERFNDASGGTLGIFEAFFFDASLIIFVVGLAAQEGLAEFIEIGGEASEFGVGFG